MSHAAATLSDMQRSTPPMDRRTPRRGKSGGGVSLADGPRFLDNPIGPGTVFDRGILRDRGPWLHIERMIPAPQSWVNWTKAGPVRAELHASNATYRRLQGASNSRYPVVNTPTTGRHSTVPSVASRTMPRYQSVPQMIPPRQDRLSSSKYNGQTYSQTTRAQGR